MECFRAFVRLPGEASVTFSAPILLSSIPSLYTHSIPWALYGKAASKAALATKSRSRRRFGDKLDAALQCMNHGQTNGIPIGPDTSLVVAELVLSAVDVTLNENRVLSGFRVRR